MSTKSTSPRESYLPVPWEFRELIEEKIKKESKGKIFFFNSDNQVDEVAGSVISMKEVEKMGMFIFLDTGAKIRIDRIITLFGKVGAAYDEYDAFANACMNCTGGYEKDEPNDL